MRTKNICLLAIVVLFSGIFLTAAYADSSEPKLTFSGDFDKIIPSDGMAEFDVTIHNENSPSQLTLSNSGLEGWAVDFSKTSISLSKDHEITIHINATPPKGIEVKTYPFDLEVYDKNVLVQKQELQISIGEDVSPITLTKIDIDETAYPGKYLPFSFTLMNNAYDPEPGVKITVESPIFEAPFVTTKSFDRKEEKTISEQVKIKPYLNSGTYQIRIRASDGFDYTIYAKSIGVPNAGSLVAEEATSYGFLKSKNTVTITNLGRYDLNEQYPLELSGISRIFTYIQPEPTRVDSSENGKIYIFDVSLKSGESMVITYTVSYVPLVIGFFALALLVFWFYSRRRCSLTKQVAGTHDKSIKVNLIAKNQSSKTIHNLTVWDTVPASLKVIREGGMVPDVVTKSGSYTRLSWKIAKLASHEERYISYKVRPTVKVVGTMSLPSAELSIGKEKYSSNRTSITSR